MSWTPRFQLSWRTWLQALGVAALLTLGVSATSYAVGQSPPTSAAGIRADDSTASANGELRMAMREAMQPRVCRRPLHVHVNGKRTLRKDFRITGIARPKKTSMNVTSNGTSSDPADLIGQLQGRTGAAPDKPRRDTAKSRGQATKKGQDANRGIRKGRQSQAGSVGETVGRTALPKDRKQGSKESLNAANKVIQLGVGITDGSKGYAKGHNNVRKSGKHYAPFEKSGDREKRPTPGKHRKQTAGKHRVGNVPKITAAPTVRTPIDPRMFQMPDLSSPPDPSSSTPAGSAPKQGKMAKAWGTVSKAGKVFTTATAVTSGLDQWNQDDGRGIPNRIARATFRGAMNAGGATLGATVGSSAGAALGAQCGPAAVVCSPALAFGGGIGGGILGQKGGDSLAKKGLNVNLKPATDALKSMPTLGGVLNPFHRK